MTTVVENVGNGPAASAPSSTTGYLILNVQTARGTSHSEEGGLVWDQSDMEVFVKVELRGAERVEKASTKKARVRNGTVAWQEPLELEVREGANELRLLLCQARQSEDVGKEPAVRERRRTTKVIAACGLFVKDVLEAVPIDKWFDLYQPGTGAEGGAIHVGINFAHDLRDVNNLKTPNAPGRGLPIPGLTALDGGVQNGVETTAADTPALDDITADVSAVESRGGNPLVRLLLLGVLVGAATFLVRKHQSKRKDDSNGKL